MIIWYDIMRYGIHIQKYKREHLSYMILYHMTLYDILQCHTIWFRDASAMWIYHCMNCMKCINYTFHTHIYVYIYIYLYLYIYIFMDHLLLRSCPLPGKKPGGIFPCKSPRKDGDEERGLPDWYTKHLEEDLHALGLPNRLGNPGGWPNRLRGCEVQEMDSKGDQGWISKDALLYIFAKKHLNILERTFDYNTLA